MKKLLISLCMCIMLLPLQGTFTQTAHASDLKNIETAWLTEYETFPIWYIQKNSLDRKAGYNLIRNMYPTGKRLIDSMHSDQWLIAGSGLVPAMGALTKNDIVIIGLGVDETDGNEILARTDNPIFTEKGTNSNFPHIYGTKESIIGKTILCPIDTNSHQLLMAWLTIFGLEYSDVIVIDIKPEDIVKSFNEGLGDFAVLWKPNTTEAKNLGFETVASAVDCKIKLSTVLFANKQALEEEKINIQDFMDIYCKAIAEIQAMSNIEQANLYKEFISDITSLEVSDNQALNTVLTHKMYNQEAQNKELNDKESDFYKTLNNCIDFYAAVHMLSRRNVEELKNAEYIYFAK